MITCSLKGGLGNQMFQIAATYSLAIDNNDSAIFDLDKCYTPLQGKTSNHYKGSIFKNLETSSDIQFENFYKEISFNYSKIPYSKNLLIDGYFQDENYFAHNSEKVKDLFHLDNSIKNKIIDNFSTPLESCVSVHVRRGDYLLFPEIHPICDVNYYLEAMNYFKPDTKFIFISDDINWVKNTFRNNNYLYADFKDEIFDLILMTLCGSNIIANSTFSWWGAYLNKNKNKKILCPPVWFGPEGPKENIIPSNWLKINK